MFELSYQKMNIKLRFFSFHSINISQIRLISRGQIKSKQQRFIVYSPDIFYLNSVCHFPKFYPKSPLYIPKSKLIYNRVIHMAKNGSLIPGFLSVLTVDDVSSGPLGVMVLRSLRASWGQYVINPQSSVSVFVTPCAALACVTVLLSQNTICQKCRWNVGFVTGSTPAITIPHVMYGKVEGTCLNVAVNQ